MFRDTQILRASIAADVRRLFGSKAKIPSFAITEYNVDTASCGTFLAVALGTGVPCMTF